MICGDPVGRATRRPPAPLVHYLCCTDHDRSLCGLPLDGDSLFGPPPDRVCVVCVDLRENPKRCAAGDSTRPCPKAAI